MVNIGEAKGFSVYIAGINGCTEFFQFIRRNARAVVGYDYGYI
ncbi:hypothetical protein NSB04_28920 [Blautia pseudococcoides]|nr:hypothetical protein [Blautia pseudococcoides]